MNTKQKILQSTGQFIRVSWKSNPRPKAQFKNLKLEKISSAVVRAGINFANLKENEGRETGRLPWGDWKIFPYVIEHRGKDYLRLYPNNKPETKYFINGKTVDRDEFLDKLPESAKKEESPSCFTVAEENIIE